MPLGKEHIPSSLAKIIFQPVREWTGTRLSLLCGAVVATTDDAIPAFCKVREESLLLRI